jgi:glutamine cyclotransferase
MILFLSDVQRAMPVWYNSTHMDLQRPHAHPAARRTSDLTAPPILPRALRASYSRRAVFGLAASGVVLPDMLRQQSASVPIYGYRVVDEFPHDRRAFTEGLSYVDGVLFESTGLEGRSSLRRVDLESGEVLQEVALDPTYFGEGNAVIDDRIFLLTWKNGICLVYDRESFEIQQTFSYDTEGWGLTTDGTQLIMSDGTSQISFRDPATFEVIKTIDVLHDGAPVQNINELELIDGEIWANVWLTNLIARINPETGRVLSWVVMSGLLSGLDSRRPVDVLNGITHDPATSRLFVTGKLWPKLFQIEVVTPE